MKQAFNLSILLLISAVLCSKNMALPGDSLVWKKLSESGYTIYYTAVDSNEVKSIGVNLKSGIEHIASFFNHKFQDTFKVYVFPDRSSLDGQWRRDWNDPTFKSECWMIASGIAHRLDILSPNSWKKEACDHNASDTAEIKEVIWHELVHVFHGQHNPDHTFSYIEKLDWLVEGVATYVSGQLDDKRIQPVRQMIIDNKIPSSLDDLWKGQNKYGLSGSLVAFIDRKYGRQKVFELLNHVNKQNALKNLAISENQLLSDWKSSIE
ncbi:MAG TPA: hypothetical protein VFP97_10715 [Chitinophagaceae bacterium]|nr:hypothetical protein [Chitinophagaceae bacterium]